MKSGEQPTCTCAFCREPKPARKSVEKLLAQLRKRVKRKDRNAIFTLGMFYGNGYYGLVVDEAKCVELLHESAGLGCSYAQYQLGNFYADGAKGLEQNEEEALKYWGKAAEGGNLVARHNIGRREHRNDDHAAAMRHWRLSASGGFRGSMNSLITCFEDGLLHHGDLAETLQAMYLARSEMKSEDRDEYIRHLKRIGKYEEYLAL